MIDELDYSTASDGAISEYIKNIIEIRDTKLRMLTKHGVINPDTHYKNSYQIDQNDATR